MTCFNSYFTFISDFPTPNKQPLQVYKIQVNLEKNMANFDKIIIGRTSTFRMQENTKVFQH